MLSLDTDCTSSIRSSPITSWFEAERFAPQLDGHYSHWRLCLGWPIIIVYEMDKRDLTITEQLKASTSCSILNTSKSFGPNGGRLLRSLAVKKIGSLADLQWQQYCSTITHIISSVILSLPFDESLLDIFSCVKPEMFCGTYFFTRVEVCAKFHHIV